MALYDILKKSDYEVLALMTMITQGYERISMHGVRNELLEEQALSLGLPLEKIYLKQDATNEDYERSMKEFLMRYKEKGAGSVVFGDIFLEDLKQYRQKRLQEIGMEGIFPIWKIDTRHLADSFISLGFKAIITCVDSNFLGKSFAGRLYDRQFLLELPSGVDPCGENGEFHSFVYDGPIFKRPVACDTGEVVLREKRYYYCDLLPKCNALCVGI